VGFPAVPQADHVLESLADDGNCCPARNGFSHLFLLKVTAVLS